MTPRGIADGLVSFDIKETVDGVDGGAAEVGVGGAAMGGVGGAVAGTAAGVGVPLAGVGGGGITPKNVTTVGRYAVHHTRKLSFGKNTILVSCCPKQ